LGLAGRVHVGRVDEIDPGVEALVGDADALLVVAVAPLPEHHRPEAVLADLDSRAAERAHVHVRSPRPSPPPTLGPAGGAPYRPWKRAMRSCASALAGSVQTARCVPSRFGMDSASGISSPRMVPRGVSARSSVRSVELSRRRKLAGDDRVEAPAQH